MDNVKLNFFYRFIYSVYNFDFYKKISDENLKKGFLYLFMLTVFLSIFTLINPLTTYFNYINNIEYKIINILPDFRIENGQLKADSKELLQFDIGGVIFIFDPGNETDESLLNNNISGFYINETKFVQKSFIYNQTINLNQYPDLAFAKSDLLKFFPILRYLSILFVILLVGFFYVGKIISVLILSIIIQPLKRRYMPQYKFSDCMKICIYGLTASFIINSIASILSIESSFLTTLLFYGLGYYFANKAFKTIYKVAEK